MNEKLIHQNHIFSLYEEMWAPGSDAPLRPFYRISSGVWINIIPVTSADEAVMVRQYRHGADVETLEIPGGMMDDDDKSPAAAARREMMEETGYDTEKEIIQIGSVNPNPALFDNRVYTFLAKDVRKVSEPVPDPWEALTGVELIPLQSIPEMIRAGQIDHSLVISAFYFYSFRNSD